MKDQLFKSQMVRAGFALVVVWGLLYVLARTTDRAPVNEDFREGSFTCSRYVFGAQPGR